MDRFICKLYSATHVTGTEVKAEMTLVFDAEDYEEAGQIVRSCLPSAGWERWQSTYGPVKREEDIALARAEA